jgi:hypothetical protein
MDMTSGLKLMIAATAMAGTAALVSQPANAQVHLGIGLPGVHVGVGVGVPAYYYGPGYYPPGPCDAYNSYYNGDCGYAVYNGPIMVDGVPIGGPHYYRWFGDRPLFWYRGGWHPWAGWTGVNFGWDHGEGWGWHGGRWDRDWGRAHYRPADRGGRDFRDGRDHRDDRDRHDDRDHHDDQDHH